MAKPKLALIPAAQGTKLYSVLPSDGVGDFTFARGSVATRINAQGLIENVASGQSRLDYPLIDGVQKGCPHHILEPARTNLIPYSEDFSNAAWGKQEITISQNVAISPDGTLNADKIIPSIVSTTHQIYDLGLVVSQTCATSIFAKADGVNTFEILDGSSASNGVAFDLSNGTFTNKGSGIGSMEYYGNGWYRCISVAATTGFRIYCPSSAGTVSGDGTSGVYIWGAMLEAGSYPTSYIPTTSTAVTRSAETATGAGNASTFNNSEGVFMAEISSLTNNNPLFNSLSIASGTTNVLSIGFSDSLNEIYVFKTNGSSSWFKEVLVNDITNFNKIALSYESNDNQFWFNGFKIETNNSIGIHPSAMSDMDFNAAVGNEFMYSNTKQIQYFDSILDSEQLEQLTSWTSFTDMAEGQLYTIE
jgi:hypothetical protein